MPFHLQSILFASAALLVFQIAVSATISYSSSIGGVFETSLRMRIPCLFYLHFIVLLMELPIYLAFISLYLKASEQCPHYVCIFCGAGCAMGVTFVVMYFFTLLLTYDPVGRKWEGISRNWSRPHPSLTSISSVNLHRAHTVTSSLWQRRLHCMFCLVDSCKCSCFQKRMEERGAVQQVAEILGDYFMADLVGTDILAGLTLLRWQTRQWVWSGHRIPMQLIEQMTTPCTYPSETVQPNTDGMAAAQLSTPAEDLQRDWLSLRRIVRYSDFALATYGTSLYLFTHKLSPISVCRLCAHLTCKCRSGSGQSDTATSLLVDDTYSPGCCLCAGQNSDLAVIVEMAGIPMENIVHLSTDNSMYASPFILAIDDDIQSIILSIRGSLSMQDVLVDLLASGLRLQNEELPTEGVTFVAHLGMLTTARRIRQQLRDRQLIELAQARRPGYPLVVCGHSLGAGVASVLAVLLKPKYPELKAYCYGNPLGSMNAEMAEYCTGFVCSVVYGYDVFSRLNMATLTDLKLRLLDALTVCNVPKFRIIGRSALLVALQAVFPCFKVPAVGFDTKLLSETMQSNLLHPVPRRRRVPTRLSPFTVAVDVDTQDLSVQYSDHEEAVQDCMEVSDTESPRYIPPPRCVAKWLNTTGGMLMPSGISASRFGTFHSESAAAGGSSSHLHPDMSETPSHQSGEEVLPMDGDIRFAGCVLHIVEVDESDSTTTETGCFAKRGLPSPPIGIWSDVRQFQSILIDYRMLTDHFPDRMMAALKRLYNSTLLESSGPDNEALQFPSHSACQVDAQPSSFSTTGHRMRTLNS